MLVSTYISKANREFANERLSYLGWDAASCCRANKGDVLHSLHTYCTHIHLISMQEHQLVPIKVVCLSWAHCEQSGWANTLLQARVNAHRLPVYSQNTLPSNLNVESKTEGWLSFIFLEHQSAFFCPLSCACVFLFYWHDSTLDTCFWHV